MGSRSTLAWRSCLLQCLPIYLHPPLHYSQKLQQATTWDKPRLTTSMSPSRSLIPLTRVLGYTLCKPSLASTYDLHPQPQQRHLSIHEYPSLLLLPLRVWGPVDPRCSLTGAKWASV